MTTSSNGNSTGSTGAATSCYNQGAEGLSRPSTVFAPFSLSLCARFPPSLFHSPLASFLIFLTFLPPPPSHLPTSFFFFNHFIPQTHCSLDLEYFEFFVISIKWRFPSPVLFFFPPKGGDMKILYLFHTHKNQTKSSGFLFACGPTGFFFPLWVTGPRQKIGPRPCTKGSCQFHSSSEKGMNTVWTISYCGWEKEFDWRQFSLERDRKAQETAMVLLVKNRRHKITWWKVQLRTGTSGAYSWFFRSFLKLFY